MHNLFKQDESEAISVDYIFIDTFDKLIKNIDAITSMTGSIAIDTETTGLDPHRSKVILLQISDGNSTFLVDCRKVNIMNSDLCSYLQDPSILKIAHNMQFDYKMLKKNFNISLRNLYCTMIAEQVISAGMNPAEKFGLAPVAFKRLGVVMDKEPQKSFITQGDLPFTNEQLLYAARDTFLLSEIRNQQLMDIEKYGLERVIQLEMECCKAISELELRGTLLDTNKWHLILEYAHDFEEKAHRKLKEIFVDVDEQPTLFGYSSINLNSQPQLLKMLNRFGLEMDSTGAEQLEEHKHQHEAVELLLEYRMYEKIRAAYGDELISKINPVTGRIHPSVNQSRASTGRMSVNSPNLQQIPRPKEPADKLVLVETPRKVLLDSRDSVERLPQKDRKDKEAEFEEKYTKIYSENYFTDYYIDSEKNIYISVPDFRECFVSAPGYNLVQVDQPSAEMRIMAALSNEQKMIESFKLGKDVYKTVASEALKIPYESVDKNQRQKFKSLTLGLAYGLSAFGLSRNSKSGINEDEAVEMFDRFHQSFPTLCQWLEKQGRLALLNGHSETILGRKRHYPFNVDPIKDPEFAKIVKNSIIRKAKNHPIQGCLNRGSRIFVKDTGYYPIERFVNKSVTLWDGKKFVKGNVVYSGKKQLVKIKLYGNNYIECSPDHKFLVTKRNGKSFFVEAKNLTRNDYVSFTSPVHSWHYNINLPTITKNSSNSKQISIFDIKNGFDRGVWAGRVASDGSCLPKSRVTRLLIAEHEINILDYLKNLTNELKGFSLEVENKKNEKIYRLSVCSTNVTNFLHENGIKSRVPDFIWSDSDMLRGYLRGMFDGDGYVDKDTVSLTFGKGPDFHLKWAEEIQQALLLFGIRSRLSIQKLRIDINVLKRDVPRFCEIIGFINDRKQNKALNIKPKKPTFGKIYGNSSRVKSVEFTNSFEDMYDVVETDTHMFMSNGLVTHNSNAELTKLSLVRIFRRFEEERLDAGLQLVVHDEFVAEAKENICDYVGQIMAECIEVTFNELFPGVGMKCDYNIGKYWVK